MIVSGSFGFFRNDCYYPVAVRLHLVVFVLIKEAKTYCFMKWLKTRYQPCNLFFLIDQAMQSRGIWGGERRSNDH
jgi:hypothetical protein